MQKSKVAVVMLFLLFFYLVGQCKAGQFYTIDWTKAGANGWANPLGTSATLITNTDYDFDSSVYPKRHDGKRHAGIDLHDQPNMPAFAIANGTVVRVTRSIDPRQADQLVIIIEHTGSRGSFFCIYGHVLAKQGLSQSSNVQAGEQIGVIKQSGSPSHLHFGINTSAKTTDFMNASKKLGWGRVPQNVNPLNVGWVNPIEYLTTTRSHTDIIGPHTATILVIDVSGSMAWQWKGGVKIASAKKAALQFIEEVANEPRLSGTSHMIGVVTFSRTASLVLPLTEDYACAKQAVIDLGTVTATNLGDGLVTGLQELDKVPTGQRFVILLSDGMTNTGMSRDQILTGPVVSARRKGVCIHTVAFGDPGDIDEDFLRKIAAGSGCGSYNYAASGFQLFGTYVKIRHAMLGSNRIVEFTSETTKGSRVYVLPGQAIALGAFQLTGPARELHYTLAWSEPGRMRAKLVDPSGREVTYTYPGAKLYSGRGFSHVTVFSPKQGIWRVAAVGATTFPKGIEYYGVASARTGGIVIPYSSPKICIYDGICIPLPDLPTALIVIISVGALAVLLYQHLVLK